MISLKNKLLKRKRFWIPLAIIIFIYLNNSSMLTKQRAGEPLLLAHRGLSQTFHTEGLKDDTCTAERIYPPEHPYLENTIPSMKTAFQMGADIVELDIHPTKDGKFAVFHDWTLDCRTNGKGVTRDYTMEQLKKLDIGYGYTADGGKTFPFRGKGIGLMPSLDEVLKSFPKESLLIHVKSNDPEEGVQLAKYLSTLSAFRQSKLAVYGGDKPIETLHQQLPNIRVMSKSTMKSCLIPYIAVGWTGYIPDACTHTELHIPEGIAPWLWGWPDRFLNRMDEKDTRVILVAGDGSFSEGFDTVEDTKRLPIHYTGVIWTNRIDRIAPIYHKNLKK
ncbi:glycerophosphodiester phosphodiesterase family protein [Thermoflavimicrobium daqui]|uniref:Glycerophosphodiester phosphodiesterase n=1 Tax=Thermoflavimicrobium daqui TaxID=2137476 RepID=A0A364K3Z6_9BACL|nr:glycerophosphodiester phosphodiesterase family protein [Thermoflavimicrobium daqui]RAL24085.1 glycerophosphodiester phosphodiesterase [Thermoflavimicrobium daqui]